MDIFKQSFASPMHKSTPDRDLMSNLFKGEMPNFESFQLLAASILNNSTQPKPSPQEDEQSSQSLVKSDEDSSNVGPSDYDNLKRYRTSYTQHQTKVLEESFHRERYISRPQRAQLAKELRLPENTIKVWFQNRRMKEKRQSMMLPNVACNDPQLRETLLKVAQMYYKNRYGGQEGCQLSEQKLEQIIAASTGSKKEESGGYSSPESDHFSGQELATFNGSLRKGDNSAGSSDEAIGMAESSTEWSALSTSPGSGSPHGGKRPLATSTGASFPKLPKLEAPMMEDFASCWKQLCEQKEAYFGRPVEKKRPVKPFTVEATLAAEDD